MVTMTLQNTTAHPILNQKPSKPTHPPGLWSLPGSAQGHPCCSWTGGAMECCHWEPRTQLLLQTLRSSGVALGVHIRVFPVLSFPFPILSISGVTQGWQGRLDPELSRAGAVTDGCKAPLALGLLRRAVPSSLFCCLQDAFCSREQNFHIKTPSIAQHPKGCFLCHWGSAQGKSGTSVCSCNAYT